MKVTDKGVEPEPVATSDITEQDLVEAKQDQDNLDALHGHLEELLKHPAAVEIAVAMRRLVDSGVEPVVIAKTMLLGDRPGGFMYQLASKAIALDQHERIAETWLGIAVRDVPAAAAANMLVAGATWLAEQCGIERSLLRSMVSRVAKRPFPASACPGAVDYVDSKGIATRAWLLDAIDHAKLPLYAPLEGKRP
jgi:hypothetical protein